MPSTVSRELHSWHGRPASLISDLSFPGYQRNDVKLVLLETLGTPRTDLLGRRSGGCPDILRQVQRMHTAWGIFRLITQLTTSS